MRSTQEILAEARNALVPVQILVDESGDEDARDGLRRALALISEVYDLEIDTTPRRKFLTGAQTRANVLSTGTEQTMTEQNTIHPWERAGLGKAPYRCTGRTTETYQACPGAPIQVGGSCDYCGTGISNTYWIQSADGKRFKVGCNCVRKVSAKGDRVLTEVERMHRKAQTAKRHAREATRDEATREALKNESTRAALAAQPHPLTWRADQGDTLLDWAEWMMTNPRVGATGRGKVAKALKKLEVADV